MQSGIPVGPQAVPMIQANLNLTVNGNHVVMVIMPLNGPPFALPFDHDKAIAFGIGMISSARDLEHAAAAAAEKQAELEAELRIAEAQQSGQDLIDEAIGNVASKPEDNRSAGSPILLPGE